MGLKSLSLFEDDAQAKAYLAYSVGNVYYAAGSYAQAQISFNLFNYQNWHMMSR
ncbi:Uncharacterised protein [Weissella viridescens]|uniref:Uncharacterized protein n=1 Tax=Weissella viridescens TaxID=1629 RepID=A0A380P7K6_WEIVI|nr:Uncharacterised protein [Weissella viridescens]